MAKRIINKNPFIQPLEINGLTGRVLQIPAPKNKKREIMFIYGHHSSIERWYGVAEALNQYGRVTVPDLPGFGGMDSFYKIGMEPTIDNFADYLAAFVKLKYSRKKVTILGMSLGFVVVTRMLQRYPELVDRVNMLVSFAGFSHKDDFILSKRNMVFYRTMSSLLGRKYPAKFYKNVVLHPSLIRAAYSKAPNARQKFSGISELEKKRYLELEVELWRNNEARTYLNTAREFLNLYQLAPPVRAKVWHIAIDGDRYFDNKVVEQHLKIIYDDVKVAYAEADNHAPTILATKDEAMKFIPAILQREINKTPK